MRGGRLARILAVEELSVQVSRMARIFVLVVFAVPLIAQKLAWESQFRSSGGGDQCTSAAVDSSGIYVAGFLGAIGTLPGQTGSGSGPDSFVRKYDTSGNELWTRQFGTGKPVFAFGLAAGAGLRFESEHALGPEFVQFPGPGSGSVLDLLRRLADSRSPHADRV